MKKRLTVKDCINLLAENKENYIQSKGRQKKEERKKLLKQIRPAVCGLREGEEIYERISGLVRDNCDYDTSIELLKRAYWFTRYWPFSLVTRVEPGGATIFTAALTLVIGILSVIFGIRDARYADESINWPYAPGIITESYVWKQEDEETSTVSYSPIVEYTYIVNGREYKNDKINYDMENRGKKWAENIVSDYPVNHPVTVYFKPDNPEFAVLEKGLFDSTTDPVYIGYALIIFSILFIIVRAAWSLWRG